MSNAVITPKRLEAVRERMRKAATAKSPVVSADDIYVMLAELAGTQAALHDLKIEHAETLDQLAVYEDGFVEVARAARGSTR
jgi:hypothetical protein